MAPKLSVVIPAYNEEMNIRLGALEKMLREIKSRSYPWEVLLTDDGSTDSTPRLLDDFARLNPGFSVLHNPHQGKAATVISGMLEASGEIVLFTDLDQATPFGQVDKILPWFSKGFDVVIGSRNSNRTGAPFTRLLMARGFMMLRTLVLGLHGITDTQCGFKAFTGKAARQIFSRLALYGQRQTVKGSKVSAGFDVETLFVAKQLGFRIKEVPVEWHYVETRRVNPLKDSWQGLVDIFRIRIYAMKGKYGPGKYK